MRSIQPAGEPRRCFHLLRRAGHGVLRAGAIVGTGVLLVNFILFSELGDIEVQGYTEDVVVCNSDDTPMFEVLRFPTTFRNQ